MFENIYLLILLIIALIAILIGLFNLFNKDRPESTLVRVVYSLMWIIIPLIILYIFFPWDLIKIF